MPGLYSHNTRSAGTVVTAAIYNTDHQNHIDNHVPDKVDDWSETPTQMRQETDPFPSQSSESLATALSGELTRLRYIIRQLANFLNGRPGISAATTALGSELTFWYYGIRNPALRTIGCHAFNTTTITHTASGSWQSMTFDSERYDQDGAGTGFHSTTVNTNRFTVPSGLGGKYLMVGNATLPSSATGNRRSGRILLNNTTVISSAETSNAHVAGQQPAVLVTCVYPLAAGDYVEFQINQDIGASQAISGPSGSGGPEFSITLVGS